MMADRYPYYVTNRSEDFDEEEVWAVVNSPKVRKPTSPSPVSTTLRKFPAASRMIPRASNKSFMNEERVQQESAPVNIPDWSKVYRKSNSPKGSYMSWDADDDDVDDGKDEWIPPHEWIAKKLARTQISSFSVCEGAGRTLKGRDLSKVRNAVLSRTGFLE